MLVLFYIFVESLYLGNGSRVCVCVHLVVCRLDDLIYLT